MSTGWPAVAQRLLLLGIVFDLWQEGVGRLILAKRADGLYAAGIGAVVLSIARQVGKTYLVGWIVFALCTLNSGLTVIWTAHHGRTTAETFAKMKAMSAKPKVAGFVEAVRSTNGEQSITFKNGSRILFGARDQGFGLGFDKVDILVLDEAQRVKEVAMADMVPATNAAPNGLVILMGTPPRPTDNGDVFANRRKDALEGDPDTLYIEISADPGAKIIDWEQVAKANPSYPHRIGKTAILRLQKLLGSDEGFYREGYGIWDVNHGVSRLISVGEWQGTEAQEVPGDGLRAFGVAFSLDGSRMAIGGAVKHSGGCHVEVIDGQSGDLEAGIAALADWLAERWRTVALIAISGQAGAPALEQALLDRGVPQRAVHVLSGPEVFAANSMFYDGIRDQTVTHPVGEDSDHLNRAVAVCDKERVSKSSSAWRWRATSPGGDETPLEAVGFAHWAVRTTKRDPNRKQVLL